MEPSPDFAWVDDIDHDRLLAELAAHGLELGARPDAAAGPEPDPDGGFQLIPLGDVWLRLEPDRQGRLWGTFVPDALTPGVSDGRPPIRIDDDSDDLAGWMTARSDIDGSGRRWVSVLRRPEREAYVALLYDAEEGRPETTADAARDAAGEPGRH